MDPLVFNSFQVRLAETPAEIDATQALRYRVFFDEMEAIPSEAMRRIGRDFDRFDEICDHLIILDMDRANGTPPVVATYRLLRRSVAEQHGGFYTEQEYDLSAMLAHPGELVELGRSCVDAGYRSRGVMQLLWRGLASYVAEHNIELMFGCASFPGTEPDFMGPQLTYLHHFHLAPAAMRPVALAPRYVSMERLPRSGLDVEAAVSEMPPLIKGYLRVGGFVGDGAVIDHQFNTTDVCMIVKTDWVTGKYERRYRRGPSETNGT